MDIAKGNLIRIIFFFFYLLAFYGVITILIPDLFVSADYRLIIKVALNINIAVTILFSSAIIKKVNKVVFVYFQAIFVLILACLLYLTNGLIQLLLIFSISTIFSSGILLFFDYFWNLTSWFFEGELLEL